MTQTSLPWANNGIGDGQPYDDDEWSDWQRKLFTHDRTLQGVVPGYANDLAVSNPAGNTIRVATGAALVDGKFYETDANVDNTITTPGAGSNYYRFVLQKDWALQTVRVAVLGPDAASPPVVTQTDGTLWEISLATVQITSGAVVTVTDTRRYVGLTMAPGLVAWQSGAANDWVATPGTTDWVPPAAKMQGGLIRWTGAASATGTKSVTFPKAFMRAPAVFIQPQTSGLSTSIFASSTTAFSLAFGTIDGSTITTADFQWWAIGE